MSCGDKIEHFVHVTLGLYVLNVLLLPFAVRVLLDASMTAASYLFVPYVCLTVPQLNSVFCDYLRGCCFLFSLESCCFLLELSQDPRRLCDGRLSGKFRQEQYRYDCWTPKKICHCYRVACCINRTNTVK